MKYGATRLFLSLALLLPIAIPAYAQGGAASAISGVVQDSAGGVIPGATVVAKTDATGTTFQAVTSSSGTYNLPSLSPGIYTVTVSLQGFKTSIITDVRVQSGIPTTVNAVLTVGGVSETVTVTGASAALINTRTATVASTLNVEQIAQIPTATRDLLLGGVTFLVGVNQTEEARGNATINGLPESFLNITMDGVSNQDNFNKSTDGFFAPVRPRQDAIEAVTVTTAVGGVEVGGSGATQINFVTRQGTNRFSGSAYEYYRDTWMNTNYWFNERDGLGKNDVQLNQYGARLGGPIVIPKLFDGRGKAFFFVHHEELRLPNNASRDRDVLHPSALTGVFRYSVAGGAVREVNVLDLARNNGQISTINPLVLATLNRIQDATRKSGTLAAQTDPLLQEYSWLSPAMQTEHQPAIRLDYNINANNRLSGTFNKLWQDRDPDQLNDFDQRFPDAPNFGHTVARRPTRSIALRSTISSELVSEFRVGITRGERIFFGQTLGGGPASFEDLNGYAIDLASDIALTNWHTRNTLSGRSAYQYTLDESLNWQKGKHTLTFGGGAFLGRAWDDSQQQVTALQLGFDNDNDPARGLFTAASNNFPGASGGQLTDARALYGLLTGRVTSVGGQATLNEVSNQYELLGRRRRAGKLNNYNAFVQDSWQATRALTITGGVRWDVQTPFSPTHDVMSATTLTDACGVSGLGDGGTFTSCRFFQVGASGGKVTPEYVQFTGGTRGYNTDWNNISPSIGVAWRPMVEGGFLRKILGDPEQATIRGGFSVAYERQGFGVFTGLYGPLPGSTLTLTRNANTVDPLTPAPVLLSETNRLFQASFPAAPVYPIAVRPQRLDSLSLFHPDIEIASARTWTVGLQRALSRNMAVEFRYVGTRGVNQWAAINYNERNLIENGFLDEFRLAVANLTANNASGIANRVGSFAYFGENSGTRPLPTYLAYMVANGRNPNDPASYTGTLWSNTDFTNDLVRHNPSPGNSAADLDGNNGRRVNAINNGLAANFFVVNPAVANVNVTDSGAFSDYHALQIEVRRRLANGLSINGNYQYAVEGGSSFLGLHFGRVMNPSENVRHAIKMQWNWSIPVGRGHRFGTDMHPILNGIIGNWDFNGAGRIQARMLNFGNVQLVGMSAKDLQEMYFFRIIDDPNPDNPGRKLVTMLPDDVILNTRRAFETSPSSLTGYSDLGVPTGRYIAPANSENCIQVKAGDCAPRTLLVRAPFFTRFDIGVTKRFPLRGSANFELRIDVLNLFDNINFNPVANPGDDDDIFQVGECLPRPGQQLRSGRPARPAVVPNQLVTVRTSQT